MPGRSILSSWRHAKVGHRVVPQKSGVHRVACTGLYKQLLRQIPHSPLDKDLLRVVLRAEFRKDAKLRIHSGIRRAMQTGYETLSLLDRLRQHKSEFQVEDNTSSTDVAATSTGTATEIPYIALRNAKREPIDLIPSLNAYLSNLQQKYPVPASLAPPAPKPLLWPYPGGNKIFDRPLPLSALRGRRRVPKLVSAGGLPMLRIKKPQPAIVTKIIHNKLHTRQKRFNQLEYLGEMMLWAQDEDEWDWNVAQADRAERVEKGEIGFYGERRVRGAGMYGKEEGEQPFAAAMRESSQLVSDKISAESDRQRELASRFWEVVKKEQALADKEMEDERRENAREWLERVIRKKKAAGAEWWPVDEKVLKKAHRNRGSGPKQPGSRK